MKAILLLIATVLLWGASPILEKLGLAMATPLTAVTIRSIAVIVVLMAYFAVTGQMKAVFTVDVPTILIFSASGSIAGFLAMITYFGALQAGATAKIVPLGTAILSIIILGEQVTLIRVIGTGLIVAGNLVGTFIV